MTAGSPIPGFVDLQVNGAYGVDFSDGPLDESACERAFERILAPAHGTAAFLPTLITSPMDRLVHNLRLIARVRARPAFRNRVPGIHLEGPFLDPTPGAIGAHNPEWVLPPDPRAFDRLQEAADGRIRILTVAAGMSGAEELIRHAVSAGVVVSLGHHLGGYEAVARARDAGATLLTHLGNGIPHAIARHDNPVYAGLMTAGLTAMVITDGSHLPDPLIELILSVKGIASSIVTSDASPVAGLPPGVYETLGSRVELTAAGRVVNRETGYLAGSGSFMLDCVNHLAGLGHPEADLVTLGLTNPARAIGLDPEQLEGPGVVFDAAARRFGPVDS